MKILGERAVVLGGGIAGLLAARVLADAYTEVVIVERDELPDGPGHRRGVPQGRHTHALLARGHSALEELFDGLTAELTASGVPAGDMLADTRVYLSGHLLRAAPSGLTMLGVSRPRLEASIRARVRALPGVTVLDRCDVSGLVADPGGGRVTGARVIRRIDGDAEETVPADLVVDATGRASRTPLWLDSLGHPRPPVAEVPIGICYTSRTYRPASGALNGHLAVITAATPDHPRGGALQVTEGGDFLLSLYGVLGDRPATDPEGFDAFAAGLRFPDIHRVLQDSKPLTDPVPYRFPASVRHRYEQLPRLPDGLLVIGDAVCTFNPVYGQGMSVAALEALVLRRHLKRETAPQPMRFQRDIGRIIDTAWTISAKADLAYQNTGTRSPSRLIERYITRIHQGATQDPALGRAFLRVAGLIDPPTALLRPTTATRVLRQTLRFNATKPAPTDRSS
ncbi:FAD-dependent monooxygenase [Actinomadura sp. 7K507]|uniref:FAD-dependent oxidoreductase n=1 Tax=Actinomadura sp. 7K507 TaxID=2530365 RepID=UPI0010524D50|nr:FAD-dependent monooxygenase [Actinomadura sp. 7K507]TDC80733.1 FAD-dependent oxidoreductase [Actinomadura sp. 7K507]